MKVSLYVVRHGQTHANARGVLQGHQDSPLTALGVQSSANTGKALQGINFSEVFSSDLGRAQDTLCQIGYKTANKFDKRLRERDYGAWSGKPWVEYKNASKRNNGTSNEFYHSLPGVETDDKLLKRWSEFFYEMLKNFKDDTSEKNVLIVTHGGMIRVITKHLMQFSSRPLGLNLAHCGIGNNSISVFELEVSDSDIINCDVVKVFDCKHLARAC